MGCSAPRRLSPRSLAGCILKKSELSAREPNSWNYKTRLRRARSKLSKAFAAIADAVVSRIMSSGLARSEKEDILRDISTWPSALKGVAERQTRLQRTNNGHAANTADEKGNGENGSDYERPRTKAARSLCSTSTFCETG